MVSCLTVIVPFAVLLLALYEWSCLHLPGPLAPPGRILPSLNITALSYSWHTFIQTHRLNGKVARISRYEISMSSQCSGAHSLVLDLAPANKNSILKNWQKNYQNFILKNYQDWLLKPAITQSKRLKNR